MLTAKQIVKAATPGIKEAAKSVKIGNAKFGYNKKKQPYIQVSTTSSHTKDGVLKIKPNRHKTTVTGLSSANKITHKYVKVSCSCEFFTYYGSEYVLHKHGAADIIYSNGEPPKIKNPKMLQYPCKHVYKLLETLIIKEAKIVAILPQK